MRQAVSLSKGQKISCGINVAHASVALNWNNIGHKGMYDLEIDVSAFILYANGKVKSDEDFIFYNNPTSQNGAVKMLTSGAQKSEISVDFTKIGREVSKIAITLTIYDGGKRLQHFGHLSSADLYLTIDGKRAAAYSIEKSGFKVETAIVVCEIYRYKDEWKFAAIGAGYHNGLGALCEEYGIHSSQEGETQKTSSPANPKKNKPKLPVVTKKELLGIADSVIAVWKTADALLRQNNEIASDVLDDDPEIFDMLVYTSIAYMGDKIKIERTLKSEIIKKLLLRSHKFTGLENVDKKSLYDLLDNAFDKLNFVEVKVGSKKTDATSFYSVIISAIGQLLLRCAANLNESDVLVYEDTLDILGSFDKATALDVLSMSCDVTPIKQLNEWYERYIATGILFDNEDQSLDELLEELNSLTGLNEVKNDINSLINMVRIQQVRKERNLPIASMSLHLVFSGNPGTGKTTVARLIAKIYKAMGLLKKGHLVEVDRSKLVAGYIGQTAIKVSEAVESAIDGVLFIDEAYALTLNKGGQDFGQEAVDTLLKAMEDRRGDFIVIVAGYNAEMQQFVLSNPGLQSRFNKYIYFEDYAPRELLSIFTGMCAKSGLTLSRDAEKCAASFFTERYNNRSKNYANARDVRNFYEKMLVFQANRLAEKENLTNEDLSYIRCEDVTAVQL